MAERGPPTKRGLGALQRALETAAQRLRPGQTGAHMPISSRLSTWVGILSAATGGFFALKTYEADVDKKVDESVAKTFELVERFHEGELGAARLRVTTYVEARRHCDSRMVTDDLTDNDFIVVLDYFDLAHACVAAKLCDGATATRFFGPYADFQWPVLTRIVDELRARPQTLRADSGFGEGMKAFARTPTPAPPCEGNF
jgi:hypothetical protein